MLLEATVTTQELAQYLTELTPQLQVAVLREALTRLGLEDRPALVEELAGALERSGYVVAAASLRPAPDPAACLQR
jgi:hypothetical protein